jgi:adenylosuccinate synthase
MTTERGAAPQTFDQLSRKQLEIYAKELRDHVDSERKLRQELEAQNKKLEQRIREITALNQLFQQHLDERLAVVNAYRQLLVGLQQVATQLNVLVEIAQSAPIPDLEESPGAGGPGA